MPATVELSLAAELRELYERQGLPASQVAATLGIPATRVCAQLRALGIPIRPGGAAGRVGRPGDPLPRVLLERLYVQEGLSVRQVAARLGWAGSGSRGGLRPTAFGHTRTAGGASTG
jgi:hypothetical protein